MTDYDFSFRCKRVYMYTAAESFTGSKLSCGLVLDAYFLVVVLDWQLSRKRP
jgi:hypothetical protein